MSEGRKRELLQKYREDSHRIKTKERAGTITDNDKTAFIISLHELIDKDAISPEKASELIGHLEAGRISLSQAFSLVKAILQEQ